MSDIIGEEGDLMEFETIDPKWTTIKLKNGVELQAKLEVVSVIYTGYKNNNGQPINIPSFNITPQILVRTIKIPRELYKKKKIDDRSYK